MLYMLYIYSIHFLHGQYLPSKLPLFYTITGLNPQPPRVINIGDTSSMAQNVGSAESMGSCCVIQRDSGSIDSDLQRGWSPSLSWGRSWEFNSMYLATLWRTCQSQIHICSLSWITYKRVTFVFDDSSSFVWGQQKSQNRERMQMYKAPESSLKT